MLPHGKVTKRLTDSSEDDLRAFYAYAVETRP
jgi:hypothetical protein